MKDTKEKELAGTNLAFVGARSSGKTTCAGLLYLSALDMSLHKSVKVRSQEKGMDIAGIVDQLRKGNFPPTNPVGNYYQADVTIEFGKLPWAKRRINLAFVDVSGEDLRLVMDRFEKNIFTLEDVPQMSDVIRNVVDASGFILIADLVNATGIKSHADMAGPMGPTGQADVGAPALQTEVVASVDAELARFVSNLFAYKRNSPQSPPFRGIAVVMTKYDVVKGVLEMEHNALVNQKAFLRAAEKYLFQTYAALKGNVDLEKVAFFYSSVEVHKETPNRIVTDRRTGHPLYATDQYDRLLGWMDAKFAQ